MNQKVILLGHLGGDPEMRFTPDGKQVANFNMATNRSWNDAEGTKQEETTWWRITSWGKLAEVVTKYLSKGRAVYVEGRMRPDDNGSPRVFQRQDGSYGASYEVTAETIRFIGGNGEKPAVVEEVPF